VSRLFDLFTSILDVVLHNARREGQLDSGIVDIKAKNVEMKEPPKVMLLSDHFLGEPNSINSDLIIQVLVQTVHIDSMSGASTVLFTFTIDRGVTWEVRRHIWSRHLFSIENHVT
jgi:hypothetical protein